MSPFQLAPEWLPAFAAAVPNFTIGVLVLVFRTRIRLFVKKLIPSMTENAEFWLSRAILLGGLLLTAIPIALVYGWISSMPS